ncbi:MAG: hypothetical protein KGH78_05095 [Candidatus Micrarchaeota archaeon]|nr:hypothetical protein [Candidatus Micrarchaeota archaeon]
MVKAIRVSVLRKQLGITKLRKIIPMTEAEKRKIRNLRLRDKRRVPGR